jgi:YVTN family beta-propeller protein
MTHRTALSALMLSALLAACGGSAAHRTTTSARPATVGVRAAAPNRHRPARPPPKALVTAETENRLLVVALPSGRVVRRLAVAPDPEDIAADSGACSSVVAVSAAAGKVTVLDRETLNPRRVIGGFESPHIPEIAPGGQYAYVTDDGRGTVTVIALGTPRVTGTIEVGASAHHLSFDAERERAWVALGESARTIVILSTANQAYPRVIGRFDPGFAAHDVSFAPAGQRAWITSANGPDVTVFGAMAHRPLLSAGERDVLRPLTDRPRARWRWGPLAFQPEPDLEHHLVVGDRAVLIELPANLGDLEPVEVPQGLARAAKRIPDRVVDRARSGPDDLADGVDMVSHLTSF